MKKAIVEGFKATDKVRVRVTGQNWATGQDLAFGFREGFGGDDKGPKAATGKVQVMPRQGHWQGLGYA